MQTNHTELTAQVRNEIKAAGITARCRKYESCGARFVQVFGVKSDSRFTESEQRQIKEIAIRHGLTGVQGSPIVLEVATNFVKFDFEVVN